MVDSIVQAVRIFPRMESKMYLDDTIKDFFLKVPKGFDTFTYPPHI